MAMFWRSFNPGLWMILAMINPPGLKIAVK